MLYEDVYTLASKDNVLIIRMYLFKEYDFAKHLGQTILPVLCFLFPVWSCGKLTFWYPCHPFAWAKVKNLNTVDFDKSADLRPKSWALYTK